MATEIAGLVVTAEGQTGDAERALDRLGLKYDATVNRMRNAQGTFVSFADANKRVAAEIQNHADAVDNLRGRLESGGREVQRFGTILTASVTLPILGVGAASIKMAASLESSVAMIRTIRPDFDASRVFSTLSRLQTIVPQTSEQLGEAAYNIVSSLDDIGEAATLNMVGKFGKGATAARVDALAFGTAILGVMNAYGMKVDQVDHIQDAFFQTVNRGIITGQELSTELATVSKAAINAGVDFDTMMALIVGATKEAGPAAENMTQLSQALNQFRQKDAQASLAAAGITTQIAGKWRPFLDVLRDTKTYYDKLNEVQKTDFIAKMMPDVRSQRGLSTLLRQMPAIETAVGDPQKGGAAQRAFEIQEKTFEVQFKLFLNTVRAAFETIGQEILPIITPLIKIIGERIAQGVRYLANLWKELPGGVKAAIVALVGFAAALGPVLVVVGAVVAGLASLASSIVIVAAGVGAAGGLSAIGAALAPAIPVIAAVVVGITALAAAAAGTAMLIYTAWTTNWLNIQNTTKQAWNAIKNFCVSIWRELMVQYAIIMPQIQAITAKVLAVIEGFWNAHGKEIVAAVKFAWGVITTIISTAVKVIGSVIAGVLAIINGDWTTAWRMAVRAMDALTQGIAQLAVSVGKAIVSLIQWLFKQAIEFGIAATKWAVAMVDGFITELWNNFPKVAATVAQWARRLANPAILAHYAVSGARAARAYNKGFESSLDAKAAFGLAQGGAVGEDAAGSGDVGAELGEGISRQKTPGMPNPKATGGGKGGGRNDAGRRWRTEVQIAELAVQEIERINQKWLTDAEYNYNEGNTLLDTYLQERRVAVERLYAVEMSRSKAEQQSLDASKLTGRELVLAQGQLNEKIAAAAQKHEQGLTEITRLGEAERKAIRDLSWQGHLQLLQTTAAGFQAVYEDMANRGVITFKQASAQIDAEQMEILIATKTGIERRLRELQQTGTKTSVALQNALNEIDQQIENFRAKTGINSRNSDVQDLQRTQTHARDLASIYGDIAQSEQQSALDRLRILEQMGVRQGVIWQQEMAINIRAANEREKLRVEDLQRQRDYIEKTEGNEQRKADLITAIDAQIVETEKRATQERENIVADFYEKQRARLAEWADRIVGSLHEALRAGRQGGIKGFFASLASSWRDTLEQMALDLLRARVLKLLETVFKIPSSGVNASGGNPNQQQPGMGGGWSDIFGTLIKGIIPWWAPNQGKMKDATLGDPASAVTRAGQAAKTAIDDGWTQTAGKITAVGDSQTKAMTGVGQSIVSTMMTIAGTVMQGSGGGFWKGLLMAAAGGFLSGLGSGLGGALTADLGGGSSYTPGGTGATRPRRVGGAMGGFFGAVPGGRFIQIAEGGFDELILTTDPSQRGRMSKLLAAYMEMTGISAAYAQGGFASGYNPPTLASSGRGQAATRPVNVYLTQEIHTNNPEAFRRTARQNARAARGALDYSLSQNRNQ